MTGTAAFWTLGALFAIGAASVGLPQQVPAHLEYADAVRMVDCDPAATAPCFRLKLNVVDSHGSPVHLEMPAAGKLASALTVHIDNQDVTPFYAAAQAAGGDASLRGRVALILIDNSGSMNRRLPNGQTRFQAAKEGVVQFLNEFEDGVDSVAIVPFESHRVESIIRDARFATTKNEALQELHQLPVPGPKNNTALYSAVSIGLDVLGTRVRAHKSEASAPEALLIVMTDGSNEILRGDDPGLLQGPGGLEEAARRVRAADAQVIGVGFGNSSEIDENALRRISKKYFVASDADALTRVFSVARTLLNSRIIATFSSPWPDRSSLAGRTLHVSTELRLANGTSLVSGETIWSTPQIGVPLFEGKCDAVEMAALLDKSPAPSSGMLPVLRPILVFIGLGALLIVLWFWVPRLVWPEQYIGAIPGTLRWSAGVTDSARNWRRAPPGFGTSATRPAERTPKDSTIVHPDADFTRTRLERDV